MRQIRIQFPGKLHRIHVLVIDVLLESRGEESDIKGRVMTDDNVISQKRKGISLHIFDRRLVRHHFVCDTSQAGDESVYFILWSDQLFIPVNDISATHLQNSNLNHLVIIGGKTCGLRVKHAVI